MSQNLDARLVWFKGACAANWGQISGFLSEASSSSIILSERTVTALASLRGSIGSPEPSLVAYVITTISTWADSLLN